MTPTSGPPKGKGVQRPGYRRRILWIIYVLPVLFFFLGAVFGDNGILKLWRLKKEIRRFEEENVRIMARNQRLEREINLLRTNRNYIEALARKELRYIKKGERMYWFEKEEEEKIEEERP